MKQRYFCSLLLGLLTLGASAQTEYTVLEDLTSKIQNANFSEGTPVSTHVRTYDYDMKDGQIYGQQEVPGWTASTPTDNIKQDGRPSADQPGSTNGRAAGLFAYAPAGEEGQFGLGAEDKYFAPCFEEGLSGNALGMVAVWGGEFNYTQDVSLPEGGYMLIFKMYNVAGDGELVKNLFGLIGDKVSYLSSKKSYTVVNEWFEDTVFVRLKEEADFKLSMGMRFGGGSGSAPHLFVDNVRLLEIDPQPLDQAEIDELKVELLKVIEDGVDLGADTSDAQAVYDNPNATLAQVQAAIEAQLALNEEKKIDLSAYFLKNPHFTKDEPVVGGICTYDYDCPKNGIAATNFSMLPVENWTPSKTDNGVAAGVYAVKSDAFLGGTGFLPPTTMSDGSTEGKVLGFVSCWTATANYTQSVTLPAGKYQIIISYYNAGGTTAIDKNLMGFVDDNGTEYLGTSKTFPVGKWTSETIKFELEEETSGYFTMGYKAANTGSGNMPHFFIEGISLIFSGELNIDPSLLALQSVLTTANKLLDESGDFQASLREEFEDAIDAGQKLSDDYSDDAEANQAAYDAINGLMDQVKASIQAYKDLQEFYDGDLFKASEKYTTGALGTQISQMSSDVDAALSDYNWTTEKIRETIASLPNIIKAGVQAMWDAAVASGEKLEEDLDITPLFEQMAYTYSETALKNTAIPDKEWNYGNASEFKTQYGTAEVWTQSPFTVSRTLAEMPKGRYTITTKGFYRTAGNGDNLANYDAGNNLAFVFARNSRTPLTNVAELVSSEQPEGWDEAASGQYVPNSQLAAYNIFEDPANDELLTKSVVTTLLEDGDLNFGITTEQMESNCWTIWYSFTITYNAADESGAADELKALLDLVQDYKDSVEEDQGFWLVTKAESDLDDAVSQAEGAEEGTVDEIKAAMKVLTDALDYAKQATSLVEEFTQAAADYASLLDEYEQTHSDFIAYDERFDELCNLPDDVLSYEDNDEIQGYIDELPVALVNYAMSQDLSYASEDDPVEITLAILNYDFEAGNTNHWTITGSGDDSKIGQNQGYQSASYTNEAEEITVSKFIEAWREKPTPLHDGDITQTIVAVLPEGYYMLEADAWSTNQTEIPEGGIQGAYLYAGNGVDTWKTSIGITETAGTPKHFAVKFYSDGINKTNIGLLVQDTNANWIAADNFSLWYIGEDTPDALGAVKDAAQGRIQAIYSVSGARKSTLVRGLNIVKTTDGARKVLVK